MKGLPARSVAPESAALIRLSDIALAYAAVLALVALSGVLIDLVIPATGADQEGRGQAFFVTGALGTTLSVPFLRRAQRTGHIGWLTTALGAVKIFLVAAFVFVVMAVLLALFLSADTNPGSVLLPGVLMILYGAPVVFLLGLVFWATLRLRRAPAFAEAEGLEQSMP